MRSADWSPFALGLGSNLATKATLLSLGVSMLESTGDIRDLRVSAFERTDPVLPDGESTVHPPYLNAVAIGRTRLGPRALMSRLLAVETALGRRRAVGCAPRTLDLDLLLFGDQRLDEVGIRIPHPRLKERSFVTRPLRTLLRQAGSEAAWAPFRSHLGDVD